MRSRRAKSKVIELLYKNPSAPKLSKGFYIACDDINAKNKRVLYSGNDTYPMGNSTIAIGLIDLIKQLTK